MTRLSVVVFTYNEEKNIERCLRSVQWADEVIVVDSFSTDRTLELARKYTSHILQAHFDNDLTQRERGFQAATGDWLLAIDADEEVSNELRREIIQTLANSDSREGYEIPRRDRVLGKWICGGLFPDRAFRLFRRRCHLLEPAEVHGGITIPTEKGRLAGYLLHDTDASIEKYLANMNDETSLSVSIKLRENRVLRVILLKTILSPLSQFVRKFILSKGYNDGFHGFLLATLESIYTFASYVKIWEYRYRQRQGGVPLPPVTNTEVSEHRRRYA